MPTFTEVRTWDLAVLIELADRADQVNQFFRDQIGKPKKHFQDLRGSWQGTAYNAAYNRIGQDHEQGRKLAYEVDELPKALRAAAADLGSHRTVLLDKIADAQDDGLSVSDDWRVAGTDADKVHIHQTTIDSAYHATTSAVTAAEQAIAEVSDHIRTAGERLGSAETIANHDPNVTLASNMREQGPEKSDPHDRLLRDYNVSDDPDGMVKWPPEKWKKELSGIFGDEQVPVTASEAAALERLSLRQQTEAALIQESAKEKAKHLWGEDAPGLTDGHKDAFRHAYWNAVLTMHFGEAWTKEYTTAHERIPGNFAVAEAMDLHNNEVGRRIAREHPHANEVELAKYVEQAVTKGDTVVISKAGRLVYSDTLPVGQTGQTPQTPSRGGHDPESTGNRPGY